MTCSVQRQTPGGFLQIRSGACFLIRLQVSSLQLYKAENPSQILSCEFSKTFKKMFLILRTWWFSKISDSLHFKNCELTTNVYTNTWFHFHSGCTFSEWNKWSACSALCGSGKQSRERILKKSDGSCYSSIVEERICEVDCIGMEWKTSLIFIYFSSELCRRIVSIIISSSNPFPVDTGRKLNVHKTFNLRPVSTGLIKLSEMPEYSLNPFVANVFILYPLKHQ